MLFSQGCGSRQNFSVASEKQKWAAEGWTYVETFGTPADDAVLVTNLSSTTAKAISAFASTQGKSTSKEYTQDNAFYLVVSMQRPSGEAFALVFTKPRK